MDKNSYISYPVYIINLIHFKRKGKDNKTPRNHELCQRERLETVTQKFTGHICTFMLDLKFTKEADFT